MFKDSDRKHAEAKLALVFDPLQLPVTIAWIDDFSRSSPHRFSVVADAYINLTERGFDPADGILRTLSVLAQANRLPLVSVAGDFLNSTKEARNG